MAVLLVLTGWFHLGTLALTALFGYFALQLFSLGRRKRLGLAIYIVAVAALAAGLAGFSRQAYVALPKIADSTIPAVVGFAEKHQIQLPFSDYESLKTVAKEEASQGLENVGRYIRTASFQVILLAAGLIVAASLFMNPAWGTDSGGQATGGNSVYSATAREVTTRFKTFYKSFRTVMGAQIIISVINTALTAMFLVWNAYPFSAVLIVLTFLCGLLPIVGNLISNTLIVGVSFTISPRLALVALIFLAAIHKLEYFLNSKIIGHRIQIPMWLTLIGLVLGEKLMGIPGMILAPVVLHYLKVESSQYKPDKVQSADS